MKIDWEKEKEKIWAEARKDFGIHIPRNIKSKIDNIAGPIREADDLDCYRRTVYEHLELIKEIMAYSYFPHPRTPQNPPERRYQRPLKKRLYLVKFVITQQLTSKKQRTKIRKTIKWEGTCRAWNEAHPNDPMTPEVLKRTFYRAIADADLQREFGKEMGCFILEALWAARLYGLLESEDLGMAWAEVFTLREVFYEVTGKPLDNRQQELELEMINNPNAVHGLRRKVAILALANSRGLNPDELKELSNDELLKIIKSGKYKKEAQNERSHSQEV